MIVDMRVGGTGTCTSDKSNTMILHKINEINRINRGA
jgi:hypothetical protein